MPRERRKIIFTAEELVLAVRSYDRVTAEFLPRGEVLSVRVEDHDEVRLVVSLQAGPPGAARPLSVLVEHEDVIELLIRACLENNIPIPRRADKSLAMVEDDLAMVMDLMDEDVVDALPRPSGPPPASLRAPAQGAS